MSNFQLLTVKNITRETPKAVSITFDVPTKTGDAFSFIAGQYVTLKTTINGEEVRRAYSICSLPGSESLSVAVKEVENGVFSGFANHTLQVGHTLEVHPPEGNFMLKPAPESAFTYMAFAAGSGITPIMSMIKTVLTHTKTSRFILIYGNKTPEDTIFLNELLALKAAYPNRFFVELCYSRHKDKGAYSGRIGKEMVHAAIKNKFAAMSVEAFYLCGPEEMIQEVSDTLVESGIEKDKIQFELFTASVNTVEITADLEGQTNVTMIIENQEFTFVMDRKETLLDAALAKEIEPPYSCKSGVCRSCLCHISQGTITRVQSPILSEDEMEEGMTLACSVHPTSDEIKISFDTM